MEKIYTPVKMDKLNLDSMFFEIIISKKGNSTRARTSSMAQIANVKNIRPEATGKSYENAVQKLIPKIEESLTNTSMVMGKVFQTETGKLMFSVENIVYANVNTSNETSNITNSNSDILNMLTSILGFSFPNSINSLNTPPLPTNSLLLNNNLTNNRKFQDIIVEWQQELLRRTKLDYESDLYFSAKTSDGIPEFRQCVAKLCLNPYNTICSRL